MLLSRRARLLPDESRGNLKGDDLLASEVQPNDARSASFALYESQQERAILSVASLSRA
jgi:hypothetical protein